MITASYKLNSLKQQYIAAINNKDDADYALLSEPTRQAYVHRISDSAVTTSAQVRDIFAEYKDELEVAKLLHDNATLDALKNAGYDKVKDLTNIDDLVKCNYQFAIKSASTKDEVVSIFKEALAANRAALRAAQDAAIKDINALPFLSDAEKKNYAAEITRDFNADGTIRNITLDDVATIRTEAINKNGLYNKLD